MSKRILLPGAIRAIREAKAEHNPAYKLGKFAVACLMSPGHLCNIEAGRRHLTVPEDVIHRIAAHLGVPVDAISYVATTEAAA